MSDRRILQTIPGSPRTVEIYEVDPVPEYWADAVVNVMGGSSVAKVTFVSSVAPITETTEQRRVVARVALPMRALLEFCNSVLTQLKSDSSKAQIESYFNQEMAQVRKLLNPGE